MCKVCPMTDAANGKGIQGNDRPSPCLEATPKEQPHKHAAVIKAWADGAQIQYRFKSTLNDWSEWMPCNGPSWSTANEYRVKPTPVPLWAVAHDAFFRHPEHLDTSRQTKWEAVAEAVVKTYEERTKAHEERKASNF